MDQCNLARQLAKLAKILISNFSHPSCHPPTNSRLSTGAHEQSASFSSLEVKAGSGTFGTEDDEEKESQKATVSL